MHYRKYYTISSASFSASSIALSASALRERGIVDSLVVSVEKEDVTAYEDDPGGDDVAAVIVNGV